MLLSELHQLAGEQVRLFGDGPVVGRVVNESGQLLELTSVENRFPKIYVLGFSRDVRTQTNDVAQ